MLFLRLQLQNSLCFHHTIGIETLYKFTAQGMVVALAASVPASSRNSLVGGSSNECQTVVRDDVSTEVAKSSSQNTLLGCTSCPRISALSQVLPDRVLRNIKIICGPRLALATVRHSPVLPLTFCLHSCSIFPQSLLEYFGISKRTQVKFLFL